MRKLTIVNFGGKSGFRKVLPVSNFYLKVESLYETYFKTEN